MASVTEHQIDMLMQGIARDANPKRVILFGSQALGTTNHGSDVDLLIIDDRPVDPNWSRRGEIGKIRRSIPPMGLSIDIVLFTPGEVERWKDATNHLIGDALRHGRVLYERP